MDGKETQNKENKESRKETVYGNEYFGIPSDCNQKQKMSSLKLTCYIVVVAVLCTLIYGGFHQFTDRYLPEMTFDKSMQPLLYQKGSAAFIKSADEKSGKHIVESQSLYGGIDNRLISMSADGKYIFFAAENEATKTGFDLCYRQVAAIDGAEKDAPEETVVLDNEVNRFKIHESGKFVLYLKGDYLYFSNLKEKKFIASDIEDFYFSRNGQQMVFYKTNGSMYIRKTAIGAIPELVDTEIEKVLSAKNEYAKIYYLKHDALYWKESGKERVCLAKNVEDSILLDESVYFTRRETKTFRFDDFFSDSMKNADRDMKDPAQNKTSSSKKELDAATQKLVRRYEDKLRRDEIRSFFAINGIYVERYNLYTVEQGEEVLVDEGLAAGTLSYHGCRHTIVYKKNLYSKEKQDIGRFESLEDAVTKTNLLLRKVDSVGLSVLSKNKKPYLAMEVFPKDQPDVSPDGKYLYCMEQTSGTDDDTLVRYEISAKELKNRTELKRGVTSYEIDGASTDVALIFDGVKLGIFKDNQYTHLSDNSCQEFFYVDGTLYFFDEYRPGMRSGTLMRFRDGEVKSVDTNVRSFSARNLKTVCYIRDYQGTGGDLYVKTGNKKREKIDEDVKWLFP